jgi:glucose/arabinose dehydrogenase
MRKLAPALVLSLLAAPAAQGQVVPDGFSVATVISGLSSPIAFELLPDGRILYAEQFTARVRLVRPVNFLQSTPVLSVSGVSIGGERGLLGLALDPAFPARPYLYLHYNVASPPHIRIARYTLSGDLDGAAGTDLIADPASRYDLVDDAPDLMGMHNGGTVRFGIEGVLYASLGEDALPCAAQSPGTLRGVILRLRTDALPPGPGSAFRAQVTPPDNPFAASPDSNLRLVAAYGLRNPFRFQVDPAFGTLAIGDVGDGAREELDLLAPPVPIPAFGPAPPPAPGLGANFGWPWREGNEVGRFAEDCGPEPSGLTPPAFEYDRTQAPGASAVISAGFYRQSPNGQRNWPADHVGDLFASDYYTGVLRRLRETGGTWSLAPSAPGQPSTTAWGMGFEQVSDWRLGSDGSLWFCRQSVDFAPNTGAIGRVQGPGLLSVPPGARVSLRLARSPAVRSAELRVVAGAEVRVRIMDASGRELRSLWDGVAPVPPGSEFALTWDGLTEGREPARPGIYFAHIESGGRRAVLRVPFLR